MLLIEPCDDLLESRVILKLEPIPQRPLRRPVLGLLGRYRLRETKEGQGEVHEPIFVVIELVLAVYDLIRTRNEVFCKKKKKKKKLEAALPCIARDRPGQRQGTLWWRSQG